MGVSRRIASIVLVLGAAACGGSVIEASGTGADAGSDDTGGTSLTTGSTTPSTTASSTTSPDSTVSADATDATADETSAAGPDDDGGSETSVGSDATIGSTGESGTEAGTTGSSCVPTDELCDAVDNDCDDVIDEGSPANGSCNNCTFVLAADGASYFAYCLAFVTWADARTACGAFGTSDLAIIDVDADQMALIGLVSGDTWIGMDDQAEEGHWIWVNGTDALVGGAPVGYDGWAPTQPAGGIAENCGELDPLQPGWADSACEDLQAYLCRHPA